MMVSQDPEEDVRIVRETLGVDETTARFIIALEAGEVTGDVVVVEEQ